MEKLALPDRFTAEGVLEPGEYDLTLEELADSFLVQGPEAAQEEDDSDNCSSWDSAWRSELVIRLEVLVQQLWKVGVAEIYIDGSFVEDKDHPNDIDGYFICEKDELASGSLQRALNLLVPQKVWTWA